MACCRTLSLLSTSAAFSGVAGTYTGITSFDERPCFANRVHLNTSSNYPSNACDGVLHESVTKNAGDTSQEITHSHSSTCGREGSMRAQCGRETPLQPRHSHHRNRFLECLCTKEKNEDTSRPRTPSPARVLSPRRRLPPSGPVERCLARVFCYLCYPFIISCRWLACCRYIRCPRRATMLNTLQRQCHAHAAADAEGG
jgi:hypothetical protein